MAANNEPGPLLFCEKPTMLRVARDDRAGDTLYMLTWREDGEPRLSNGMMPVFVTVRERDDQAGGERVNGRDGGQ